LNRASDYGSEGYRFESCRRHKIMQRPVFRQVAFCFRLYDHSAVADSLFLRLVLPPTYTRENFRPPIKSVRTPSVPTPDHSNNFEIPVSEKHLKTNRQNIQILPKRSTTLLLRRQLENAPSPFLAFISCNSRYFLNEHNAIPSSIDPST
jgi:hypothetical protein